MNYTEHTVTVDTNETTTVLYCTTINYGVRCVGVRCMLVKEASVLQLYQTTAAIATHNDVTNRCDLQTSAT